MTIELFSGAGGLALGVSQAGFQTNHVIERDTHACATMEANRRAGVEHARHWNILCEDVSRIDFAALGDNLDLLAAGPPCQPFSLGGRAAGSLDERDMFPEAIRAVAETRPRAFIIENVRGLLRPKFRPYVDYMLLRFAKPRLRPLTGEGIDAHTTRLRAAPNDPAETYKVSFQCVNAADYGVPQKRERVFIVGFRRDLNVEWRFPAATHSREALLWSQFVTGEYWERHGARAPAEARLSVADQKTIANLRARLWPPETSPWATVRDAIGDLPNPRRKPECFELTGHEHRPGARSYPGHTGSPWDMPAKALKAGDHGVPGGENMLRHDNGRVRYFTVREAARIQTFPDDYVFSGAWTEAMRQLGNAVPVRLAKTVAASVEEALQINARDLAAGVEPDRPEDLLAAANC